MSKADTDLAELEKILQVSFSDKELLRTALTHRSWVNENREKRKTHNERLEFLGDAVLELVVTEFLFNRFKDKPEGVLTSYRSALVNTQSLAYVAKKLGINDFLYLSKGESKDKRARDGILADALEAIIGAIYIQRGYEKAKKFILDNIASRIDYIISKKLYLDPKSALQEIAQEKIKVTPTYKIIKEEGPDHDKTFTVQVIFGDTPITTGVGRNKQEAERDAARNALEIKKWI